MSPKTVQFQLGLGACVVSLVLGFIAIPTWVSSPSNVSHVVLSPVFWPYVLTTLTGLIGIALLGVSRHATSVVDPEDEHPSDDKAWFRLAGLAVIMILTMFALPRLGMVWTTMIVFGVTALLFQTRHPKIALICAITIPLLLYVFFAHVAGVAIPQGIFVRLP